MNTFFLLLAVGIAISALDSNKPDPMETATDWADEFDFDGEL